MPSDPWPFDVTVLPPDTASANIRERKTGQVLATFRGVDAGWVSYGTGPEDSYLITNAETYPNFKGHGCLTQMVEALRRQHPGARVCDGGNSNTKEGDLALAALQAKGLIDQA